MNLKFWGKKTSRAGETPQDGPVATTKDSAPPPQQVLSPDFDRETVIEIEASVSSPPYAGPETVKISCDGSSPEATVVYSGLVVDGWQTPDHGAVRMHEPKTVTVPAQTWNPIIDALRKDRRWFAAPPEGGGDLSGTKLFLKLTLVPRDNPAAVPRMIVVSSKYFTGGAIPDEFQNVMKLVAGTYSHRNILSIAHYD